MKLVLDTSALSRVMARDAGALARLAAHRPGDVVLTTPVAAEALFGIERLPEGRRRKNLAREYERVRGALRWHDWTDEAAHEFGRQKARLEKLGNLVDDMDVAIGSIALCLGCAVATCNARHFRRIEGLVVEDWD